MSQVPTPADTLAATIVRILTAACLALPVLLALFR